MRIRRICQWYKLHRDNGNDTDVLRHIPLVIDRNVRRQALTATLVSILPIVLFFFGVVTQLDGALLLVIFFGYTFFLFRTDRAAIERMAEEDDDTKAQPACLCFHWKPVVESVWTQRVVRVALYHNNVYTSH